jgi:hypothetical protein
VPVIPVRDTFPSRFARIDGAVNHVQLLMEAAPADFIPGGMRYERLADLSGQM